MPLVRARLQTPIAVVHALGGLLLALAVVLLVPLAVGLVAGEAPVAMGLAFGVPAAGAAVVGLAVRRLGPPPPLGEVRAMLLCGIAWIVISAIGAIPFVVLWPTTYLDAVFETVSGFTTTGITVYAGLDQMPASLAFWRHWTQWFGGLGILTLFMALTGRPAHALAGAEAHKIAAARPRPGLFNTLRALWLVYLALTLFVVVGLLVGGVGPWEAVLHSFTTVSTGGFSTHDASIAAYRAQPGVSAVVVEWVIIVGMLGGGTSFLVHYQTLRGSPSAWWRSAESRTWIALIVGLCALLLLDQLLAERAIFSGPRPPSPAEVEEGVRTDLFQVLAILTTTGYATQDIATPYFGPASQLAFLAMMLIGGCVGSTGGGFKVLRIVVLAKLFARVVVGIVAPRGAIDEIRLDGRIVPAPEVRRVAGLFFAWMGLLLLGGFVTALLTGHGPLASVSGMFSALNNIGPCYIPVQDMATLPATVKLVYMAGMLAGRLELLPIALLLSPRAWKSDR